MITLILLSIVCLLIVNFDMMLDFVLGSLIRCVSNNSGGKLRLISDLIDVLIKHGNLVLSCFVLIVMIDLVMKLGWCASFDSIGKRAELD